MSQRMGEIPSRELFEKALRVGFHDETINVIHVKDNSDFAKGTNFFSSLLRIRVTYTVLFKNETAEKIIDLIVKSEPTDDITLTMIREQNFFMRELTILKEVLPKIEKLTDQQIGPKLLYGSSYLKILIMEDLSKRGFVMKDRQEGLLMGHCLLVIEQLAKLHAGSVALHEKEPELFQSLRNGGILSSNCSLNYMRMLEMSLSNVSKAIRDWPNQKYTEIASKLDKLVKTFRDKCSEIYKYEPDEFCVLNHGDCWINNIMFTENDNSQPCEVLLLDYQMSVYSSPAIDLHYFLNICPRMELKYEKDDVFLNAYLETLRSTMTSIGCTTKAPTIENLKAAMHKRRLYAVFAGVILYLRMMANIEDIEDFVEVMDKLQGETKMDVFKNPNAVILAQKMIPIMDQRGYFD